MNTVTALKAALESAGAHRDRTATTLARLDVEAADLRSEYERARNARGGAADALAHAHEALDATKIARAARESELASARLEHEWRARDVRSREHELAALTARLRSLEELDAHRAGFSDAARMVLVQANGRVGQLGALADVLDVQPQYERAVEACLGELLQHVLVRRHEHAAAGLSLVRQEDAGRCGFVVVEADHADGSGAMRSAGSIPDPVALPAGAVRLSDVVTIGSEFDSAVRAAIGDAVIVDGFDAARDLAPRIPLPVATIDGDVLHGAHLVAGGGKVEARGILATKREIKELRERVVDQRAELERLAAEAAQFEHDIAQATAAIAALTSELHRQEKGIVAVEGQLQRATEDETRLSQRSDLVATEMAHAREEIATLEARQAEARESIARLDEQKVAADAILADAQRRLAETRESADALSRRAAEARAAHAGLVERSAAVTADVERMQEAAGDLERRVEACTTDLSLMRDQRERLLAAVLEGHRLMDDDVRALETLRDEMRGADERAGQLKLVNEQQEEVIRDARRSLDAVRALAAELDVTRATAEGDLSHLAQQCLDSVAAPLDDVRSRG